MKAVVIRKFGPPDVMNIEEIHKPVISSDEMLVRVHYSSVNPVDWRMRNGSLRFLIGSGFPMILGFDIAGEVVETGSSVTGFKNGDRVFAMLDYRKRGAYAEYARVGEASAVLIPDNVDFKGAAAIPLAALTAYQALHHKGKIKAGDLVLINGSSGGVGSFAVQIAKAAGARVTAVCGTENIELVRTLGADKVMDYTKQNVDALLDIYDIIFDTVGTLSFLRISGNLTKCGSYITTIPKKPAAIFSLILVPVLSLFGYRKKSTLINVRPSGSDLNSLSLLVKEKKVGPLIDRVFTLEEIREAHAYSETGRARGKIVIKIS